MPDFLSLTYFIGITTLSLVSFFFAATIYRSTKNATKGWLYLSIFIGMNAALALIGIIRVYLPSLDTMTRVLHGLLSLAVAVVIIKGSSTLLGDFGKKGKGALYAYLAVFVALVLFVVMKPLSMRIFTGFTHLALASALIVSSVSFIRIYLVNKGEHWYALSAATMLDGISLFGLAYLQGCCNRLVEAPACMGVTGISETPLPQMCTESLVNAYVPAVWLSLFSFLMGVIAYYLVYRFWKKTVYG